MADEHSLTTPIRQRYARWLHELREAAGYTQQELARLLGVHRSLVSHIESGKRVISVDTLGQFRSVLLDSEKSTTSYRERVAKRVQSKRLAISPRLSQEALSEKAGCSVGYVAKVEAAAVNTTIERVERLAHSLGVPVSQLLDD